MCVDSLLALVFFSQLWHKCISSRLKISFPSLKLLQALQFAGRHLKIIIHNTDFKKIIFYYSLYFICISQIHLKEDGTVNIYSRNQENNTTKYPDIISRLKNALGEDVKSCVIDSEAVAWDQEKKQILPFQVLSTRKRKVF